MDPDTEPNEGITACIACMNRPERLALCVEKLLTQKRFTEIVVVDWGSDHSVLEVLEQFSDARIVLAVVTGVECWDLSKAYNLAARLARGQFLCKMDVDYELAENFFDHHPPDAELLLHGDHRRARNTNEVSLSGFFIVARSAFWAVNGFNERLEGWGYDDLDLYDRLEQCGTRRVPVDFDYIIHVPHDTNMRTVNQPGLPNYLTEHYNRLIARMCPWGRDSVPSSYNIERISPNLVHCEYISPPGPVPPEVDEVALVTSISHLTRRHLRELAAKSRGTLWGRSPEEVERLVRKHAPRGPRRLAWRFRRELKELFHLVKRGLESAGCKTSPLNIELSHNSQSKARRDLIR